MLGNVVMFMRGSKGHAADQGETKCHSLNTPTSQKSSAAFWGLAGLAELVLDLLSGWLRRVWRGVWWFGLATPFCSSFLLSHCVGHSRDRIEIMKHDYIETHLEKHEYIEGPQALANFNRVATAVFQSKKTVVPVAVRRQRRSGFAETRKGKA